MYVVQMHRSTKRTAFSLLLGRHLSSPAPPAPKLMPPHVNNIEFQLDMQFRLINRYELLRRLADKNLRVVYKRYRQENDKKVHFEAAYPPGDKVSVKSPSLTTPAIECLAAGVYSKLMPKAMFGSEC